MKEGLVKNKTGTLRNRVYNLIRAYNSTYHSAIKCTPKEANWREDGEILWQNSRNSKYAEEFKTGFREKFVVGQKVRVSNRENLDNKYDKGRFFREGVIVGKFNNDSYIVKDVETDKINKKRHSEVKAIKSETNRLEAGMLWYNPT